MPLYFLDLYLLIVGVEDRVEGRLLIGELSVFESFDQRGFADLAIADHAQLELVLDHWLLVIVSVGKLPEFYPRLHGNII